MMKNLYNHPFYLKHRGQVLQLDSGVFSKDFVPAL